MSPRKSKEAALVFAPIDDMIAMPCAAEILYAADLAVQFAGKGPDLAFVAFAQMLNNRRRAAHAHVVTQGRAHPHYGRGSLTEACRPNFCDRASQGPLMTRSHLRAMASICRVAAGEEQDPTAGATLCHRHDEEPDWANEAVATALIGDLIFYTPPRPA